MTAYVIGIVRSRTRLEALTYEARGPIDRLAPWRIEHVCELRPLTPQVRPALWRAWHALAAVDTWDAATLAAVRLVLDETVPALDDAGELPALGAEVHMPEPPRATAAHPRAYRGTHIRPPRPAQPVPVDVRAYLLARRHIDQVLAQLGAPAHVDPTAGFDSMFVMQLWPLFADARGEIGAFAALASTFALATAPVLRGALVGIYRVAGDPARALGWWSHVLAHEPKDRVQAAQLVAASGVAAIEPIDADFATITAALEPTAQWSIYRALARGAAPVYLTSGLALDAISEASIDELPAGDRDVTEIVTATVTRLATAMDEDSGAAFWRGYLWRCCGAQPGLAAILARPDFVSLEASAAFWMLRWVCIPSAFDAAPAMWRALAPVLPPVLEIAAEIAAPYHRKFIEDLADASWHDESTESDVRAAIAGVVGICRRVARPPFGTESVLGPLTACLAPHALHAHMPALEDAPDASWLALETASQRLNDGRIIARGLARIAKFAPALLATFATAIKPLMRTADTLMMLSEEAAEAAMARYRASPIAGDVEVLPIADLCALVDPIARAGGQDPVRKALRRHLAGEIALGDAQLAGHRARIIAALGEVRLAALRQIAEADLATRVGVDKIESVGIRHAMGILRNAERQRPQLRRMLAANLSGDASWRLRHPRTQEWLARHPELACEVWLAGHELVAEVPDVGRVRIAVEHDPLEALKLGTYVGSCLGRGGNLEYSAAASVLDVNKHVVYARDSRNAVIGRQLVAISEAEELVCFYVYGSARKVLEPLFRDFDQAFARALGVPLYTRKDGEDYVIANVLSHEWWDDSVWD